VEDERPLPAVLALAGDDFPVPVADWRDILVLAFRLLGSSSGKLDKTSAMGATSVPGTRTHCGSSGVSLGFAASSVVAATAIVSFSIGLLLRPHMNATWWAFALPVARDDVARTAVSERPISVRSQVAHRAAAVVVWHPVRKRRDSLANACTEAAISCSSCSVTARRASRLSVTRFGPLVAHRSSASPAVGE